MFIIFQLLHRVKYYDAAQFCSFHNFMFAQREMDLANGG